MKAGYLLLVSLSLNAFAKTEYRSGLAGWQAPEQAKRSWKKYCVGSYENPGDIPSPNYNNIFIKNKVVPKLSLVDERSYYFYKDVLKVYDLWDSSKQTLTEPSYEIPLGLNLSGNAFLVYLCGEFRDRPSLIEEKLRWVSRIYKLPVQEQKAPFDMNVSPFSQFSAKDYESFIDFTKEIFDQRSKLVPNVKIGKTLEVDSATEGFTICETKYILSEYMKKNVPPSDLWDQVHFAKYQENYLAFKDKCSQKDKDHYYDFRGDSNFKPNSPESNAMIWAGNSIAKMCETPVKAKISKPGTPAISDQDCKDYFTKPFESRWNKARQGLMTWLFFPGKVSESSLLSEKWTKAERQFSDTKELITILPNRPSFLGKQLSEGFDYGPLPYAYKLNPGDEIFGSKSDYLREWTEALDADPELLHQEDMGFNSVFGLNDRIQSEKLPFAFYRLRYAVDRHTDWYQSGYDDDRGRAMNQAYSPFVASSYEPSKSNQFISCGFTVACSGSNPDTRKQWMFVFKVHKDNWYRTQDLAAGKTVNFSKMWFDETTFGATGLADEERAFDRLGTPLEGEYAEIMYVHNNLRGNVSSDELAQEDPYQNELLANLEDRAFKIQRASKEIQTRNLAQSGKKFLMSFDRPRATNRALVDVSDPKDRERIVLAYLKRRQEKAFLAKMKQENILAEWLYPELERETTLNAVGEEEVVERVTVQLVFSEVVDDLDLAQYASDLSLKAVRLKVLD